MSADNWGVCPVCLKNAQKEWEEKRAEWIASYGLVSPEEYERSRPDDDLFPDEDCMDRTLREDYEAYIDSFGEFYFSYSALCFVCDFRHKERIEKAVV